MRVRIYSVDQGTSAETFEGECEFEHLEFDDGDAKSKAQVYLEEHGRYWVGGGAAELKLLMRV